MATDTEILEGQKKQLIPASRGKVRFGMSTAAASFRTYSLILSGDSID